MSSFTDTFKRKEVKYLLSEEQLCHILKRVNAHMELDTFGRTTITSLYFDTAQRELIARSLEKPLYKEKLRVRWYGEAAPRSRAFVEIKKKYKGIVYKRRVSCTREAAAAMLVDGAPYESACRRFPLEDALQQDESLSAHSLQIAAEIAQFQRFHGPLLPSMYIRCERHAYALPAPETAGETFVAASEDLASDLRITFDANIAYRDVFAEAQGAPQAHYPLVEGGQAIMEVKTSGAFPFWLVDALNAAEAYPSSFSKYGTAYQAVTPLRKPRAAAFAHNPLTNTYPLVEQETCYA